MKRILVLTIVIGTLLSCMEEQVDINSLNFTNANFDYDIAINGFISTERTRYRVTLTTPAPLYGNIDYLIIKDATVTITDGINSFPLEWDEMNRGYFSVDSIQGIPGVCYTLNVLHNGKSFTASDTLPLYPMRERIKFKLGATPSLIATRLNDENWVQLSHYQHVFGYDSASIMLFNDQYRFYSDTNFPAKETSDIVNLDRGSRVYLHRGSVPQGVFPAGLTFIGIGSGEPTDSAEIVYMTLSNTYYEYLITVFNETDWKAGLFSTIPGNTKGNVSEGGVGYFYAVNASRFRMTYLDLLSDQIDLP